MSEETKSSKKPMVRARVFTPSVRTVSEETPKAAAVTKAEAATAIEGDGSEWRTPPYNMGNLKTICDNSTIIPQCIEAYKTNITGFGVGIKYKDEYNDDTGDEGVETAKAAEFSFAQSVLNTLCIEKDISSFFSDIVASRECFGIAYAEVVRNAKGFVIQLNFIEEPDTITKTYALGPAETIKVTINGYEVERKKKFCKYKQTKNGKTIYFKEMGDKRTLNALSGDYIGEENKNKVNDNENIITANELVEFRIGYEPYGKPRYYGQLLGVSGSRQAEELNIRYFKNGRHTPLAICVNGGTLSPESHTDIQQYMNEIQGENGQHAFLLLEMEENDDVAFSSDGKKASIDIKPLAEILQKDGLFKEYINDNRRSAQSSFRLPDLYVAYTTDFNRATAQAAIEITEQQVFIPERKSLAWIINNKILSDYNFKYVEVELKNPNVNNIEDLAKILSVGFQAGGITPNKAKDIIYSFMGEESEDYPEDWGDIPLPIQQLLRSSSGIGESSNPLEGQTPEEIQAQIDSLIEKALTKNNEEMVPVMKSVRDLLLDLKTRNGV